MAASLPLCFRVAEYAPVRIPALEATASKAVAEGTYVFEDVLLLGACERCAARWKLRCSLMILSIVCARSRSVLVLTTPTSAAAPPPFPDRMVSAQQRKRTSSTRRR